ncbi:MAG: glycosyltransferase [Actinomycetota bacterium]|nr:glycosyltransferase [Actinomycetota bacterium]
MSQRSTVHAPPTSFRRIGMVGTYPPKLCGLATFAAALVGHLRQARIQVDVVRIDDGDGTPEHEGTVVGSLVNGSRRSLNAAAVLLSRCDVAVIQHEYGIFGGADGDEVVDLMKALQVPTIVTLHTVPLHPTDHQRSVLEVIVELSDRVVVMSASAHERLISLYSVDPQKVTMIPHGASAPNLSPVADGTSGSDAPDLLTWGLLGPGKGIEHVIDALGMLAEEGIRPRYTVAGVTHPKVLAHFGDAYRQSLIQRCIDVGVAGSVTFDDSYRTVSQLMRFVATAAVVVLPYDSRDQVTSGVLVDAVAAGRPVIATAFPHAVELLASGAGIIVPHADAAALALAIRSVISDPAARAQMGASAQLLAPTLSWSIIASQYSDLSDDVCSTVQPVAI